MGAWRRRMPSMEAVVLALLCAQACTVSAGLLATAQIEQCVDSGDGAKCEERVTLSLSLFGGQKAATERLEANITSMQRSDGSTVKLLEPMVIVYEKSTPQLVYPIAYIQSVNHKPTERVKITSNPCVDASDASNPTCGWRYDVNKRRVPNSQGYCCRCDASQILKLSNTDTRAGLSCNFEFTWGTFSKSSAHCLLFDELWWDVYEIQPLSTVFYITVTLYYYSKADNTWKAQALELSPVRLSAQSADGAVVAQLVGNFAPFTQLASFTDRYFMLPGRPASNALVQAGQAMLVDKYRFDLSGFSCNKIGVADAGFRSEARACSNVPGSCLNQQPVHLYEADVAKMASGLKGDFLVSNFGAMLLGLDADGTAVKSFVLQLGQQLDVSLITLTFAATDLRFVINESPGNITDAYVKTFEAQSKNGELVATVKNTGSLVAEYSVGVENCSSSIQPVVAKRIALAAQQSMTVTFDLYSTVDIGLASECTVTLYNSQGLLVSSRLVQFNTTDTNITRGAQGGEPRATPSVERSLPIIGSLSCAKKCPNLYALTVPPLMRTDVCWYSIDLWCFLTRNCIGFLFRVLAVVLGSLCICCCCCKLCKKDSCLRRLFCSCFSSSRDGVGKMKAKAAKKSKAREYVDEEKAKGRVALEMPTINLNLASPQAPPQPVGM